MPCVKKLKIHLRSFLSIILFFSLLTVGQKKSERRTISWPGCPLQTLSLLWMESGFLLCKRQWLSHCTCSVALETSFECTMKASYLDCFLRCDVHYEHSIQGWLCHINKLVLDVDRWWPHTPLNLLSWWSWTDLLLQEKHKHLLLTSLFHHIKRLYSVILLYFSCL